MNMTTSIGYTINSPSGARACYRPDWSASLPWVCYYANGTAAAARGSRTAAMNWLGGKIDREFDPAGKSSFQE